MDHTILIDRFFRESGSRVQIDWNCFQPPYDAAQGWPLRLPDVDWSCTDWLVLVFQDFVTMRDGVCIELEQVEQSYGDDADRVIVLHWPVALEHYYQGPIQLVHFDVHEYMILLNLGATVEQWQHVWNMERQKAWQCLNGRKCPHRLWVAQYLEQNWGNGTLGLGDAMPLTAYPYSTYRGTSNEDNWQRLLPIYGQHVFNIVTETQYDQRPGIITEKTFFAVLAAQIPIVIGYPGIVKDCIRMGFDMFSDIVDISYDDLPDGERWQAALTLNRDIACHYQPSSAVQRRLDQQAEWLLWQWPEQHITACLDRLRSITTQG
jgi:hypothetical protein